MTSEIEYDTIRAGSKMSVGVKIPLQLIETGSIRLKPLMRYSTIILGVSDLIKIQLERIKVDPLLCCVRILRYSSFVALVNSEQENKRLVKIPSE